MVKKRLLIKLTGNFLEFNDQQPTHLNERLFNLAVQLKELNTQGFEIALLVGGGNIFRGSQHGKRLSITPSRGHTVGMLATVINGIILADLLAQQGIKTTLLSAFPVPGVVRTVSAENCSHAFEQHNIIIFAGGIGTAFFSTDTAAIVRALEIQALSVWKATSVPGVFDKDPFAHTDARLLRNLTHKYALEHELNIMDHTALVLAKQHNITIRVFDIFTFNALLMAAHDQNFGSTIYS